MRQVQCRRYDSGLFSRCFNIPSSSPTDPRTELLRHSDSEYPGTRNINTGLNRRSGIRRDSLSRVAATSAVISIEPLPAESRCEEKGIFSVKRTHLTKELSHDIASATHDRGHAS